MSAFVAQFAARLNAAGLAVPKVAEEWLDGVASFGSEDAKQIADWLVERGRLTSFQAKSLLRDPPMRLALGRYVLLDMIGEGGMGQVFKARHARLERLAAIKLLHDHAFDSPEAVRRFHQEVKTAGMLRHPNIVLAYDADEWQGRHYLVMEYVDGRDLAAIARDRPPAIEQAAGWIAQAARGLAYAHGEGVVHRDIKPSNLLLDRDGVVKVLDLGIARVHSPSTPGVDETTATQLTQSGAIIGTVDFMAPEQALNLRHADARSDIYSLGCTLFQILAGRPAFDGATVLEKIIAHRERELPSLREFRPDAPEAIENVVERMVAKRPEDRFQSMHEVVAMLESLLRGSQLAASAPTLFGASLAAPPAEPSALPTRPAQPTQGLGSNTSILSRAVRPTTSAMADRVRRLIDGCTAVDRFLCRDEKNHIFRAASDLDCSLEEIEAAIAGACELRGWTRQTKLSAELATLLEKASSDGRAIDRRAFDEAVGFAVERHMPRKAAMEHCATLILDKRLPVREGLRDKWFARVCRQFGLN